MNRLPSCVLLFLFVSPSAIAHDFWIEPSTFTPAPGEEVVLQMKVGEHFQGEIVTTSSIVVSAEGTVASYSSRPSRIELEAAKFESYLREEGLEHVIEKRKARGESAKRGTEIFSRSVKTLLGRNDETVGLRLELVRTGDRFRVQFEGKPVRDLLVVAMLRPSSALRAPSPRKRGEGQVAPRPAKRGEGGRRPGEGPYRARSDANGMVAFPRLAKGQWLVK